MAEETKTTSETDKPCSSNPVTQAVHPVYKINLANSTGNRIGGF